MPANSMQDQRGRNGPPYRMVDALIVHRAFAVGFELEDAAFVGGE